MRTGKDAGIVKILMGIDAPLEERGAPNRRIEKHAGMGALVDRRHVITCAHVVNVAIGEAKKSDPKPTQSIGIVFPLSVDRSIVTGQVVEWYPVGGQSVSDVAVVELSTDAPADVGITVFGLINRPLDGDELSVFGTPGGQTLGVRVATRFVGPTSAVKVQIGRSRKNTPIAGEENKDIFIQGGFSGAFVWNFVHQTAVGMVTSFHGAIQDVAYMIPTTTLAKAWSGLPTEIRRLPRSFNAIWTVLTSIFVFSMLYFLWSNRRATEADPDILSPFWGLHVYALLALMIGCLWYIHAKDFKLSIWSSKSP